MRMLPIVVHLITNRRGVVASIGRIQSPHVHVVLEIIRGGMLGREYVIRALLHYKPAINETGVHPLSQLQSLVSQLGHTLGHVGVQLPVIRPVGHGVRVIGLRRLVGVDVLPRHVQYPGGDVIVTREQKRAKL